MTETGLLIAEAAFLILLFVFIWSIVRSSSNDLRAAEPLTPRPQQVEPVHAGDTGNQPAVISHDPPTPVAAPEVVDPPVPAAAAPVAEAVVDEAAADAVPSRERPTGPAFDFSVNIRPRLLVSSSPSLASELEFPLEAGMTIGRSRSNGIPISDSFASHMHARVFPHGQFFYIEDLGSTNGTFVNGRRIEDQTQLKVHDEIRLGETVLRYEE